jgi:hypothetical protein
MIARLMLAAHALAIVSPALATARDLAKAGPQSGWKSQDALKPSLVKQGWQVRKSKVDGGLLRGLRNRSAGQSRRSLFPPGELREAARYRAVARCCSARNNLCC